MMKKTIITIVLLLMILAQINHGHACTSFAVYGDEPIYAMNFDYPKTELKFVIVDKKDTKAFYMQFKEGNRFSPTVGMNDKGLFISTQMQYPQIKGQSRTAKDEIFLPELTSYIQNSENVPEILQAVEDKRFVHLKSLTLHNMLADAEGNAIITEVGNDKNELLSLTGDFMVMTNFKNSDFKDSPYDKVSGTGAYRYIKAYQYIDENREGFCLDNAFEGLRMTAQNAGYPTLSSMVFLPGEQSVYFALHRDFERIWKVSLQDKTIETYKGFEENRKFFIPNKGVLASDLINNDFSKYKAYDAAAVNSMYGSSNSFIYLMIASLAVIGVLLLIFWLRKKQKAV